MKIPLATLSLRPSCLRNVGLLLLCLLSAGWLATPAVAAVNATASGNASLTGTGTVSIRWQVSYPITLPQGTTVRGINGVIAVPNGPVLGPIPDIGPVPVVNSINSALAQLQERVRIPQSMAIRALELGVSVLEVRHGSAGRQSAHRARRCPLQRQGGVTGRVGGGQPAFDTG